MGVSVIGKSVVMEGLAVGESAGFFVTGEWVFPSPNSDSVGLAVGKSVGPDDGIFVGLAVGESVTGE